MSTIVRTGLLHHAADLELYGLNQQPRPADVRAGDHEVELAADVDEAERVRLELDYPRAALPRPAKWEPFGPSLRADIAEYVAALRHGAARLLGELSAADEDELAARLPLLAAVLRQAANDLDREFTSAIAERVHWGCLMRARSDWSRSWRRLPLWGRHRALGDAEAALDWLRAMTSAPGRRPHD